MPHPATHPLLPCPFCGSRADYAVVDVTSEDAGGIYVQCANGHCAVSTPMRLPRKGDPIPLLQEQWNRRALPPNPPEAIERARKVLVGLNGARMGDVLRNVADALTSVALEAGEELAKRFDREAQDWLDQCNHVGDAEREAKKLRAIAAAIRSHSR